MKVKNVILFTLYLSCVVTFIVFAVGLATLFGDMRLRGFDLTEYWQLAVFGFVCSLAVSVYSLVMLVPVIIRFFKDLAERRSTPKSAEAVVDVVEGSKDEGIAMEATEAHATVAEVGIEQSVEQRIEQEEKPKRLSKKERRRQKLLAEEKKKEPHGLFGITLVVLVLVFNVWFSVWTISPNELCFHQYSYADVNAPADVDEIKVYRFYQDALGNPYYIQQINNGERSFQVPLAGKDGGEDENGKYVLYRFSSKERYAIFELPCKHFLS